MPCLLLIFSQSDYLIQVFDKKFTYLMTNSADPDQLASPEANFVILSQTVHMVILCHLPEKGRRKIEEIVDEMKERDRGERKMNESEGTEEI